MFFSGPELCEPTIGLGGLAPPPLRLTSPVPCHRSPFFPDLLLCFLRLLNLPSQVRVGLFLPEIGPFRGLFAADIELCEHLIPDIVSAGLVPPPFRPTTPSVPIHRRRANHAPPLPGIDLDRPRPASLLPHAPPTLLQKCFAPSRCGPYQDTIDPFFAPKPSSCLFFSPRHRLRFASQPRERSRGRCRSSWIGFQAVFVFPSAHHWRIPFYPSSSFVGPLFSQSHHGPTSAAGNREPPFRLRFFSPVPVATLPGSSNLPTTVRTPRHQHGRHLSLATRAPPCTRALSSPELRDQRSTFFRAPSSPEFRRHPRFATRAPSSPELCRHLELRGQSSTFIRAPPFA